MMMVQDTNQPDNIHATVRAALGRGVLGELSATAMERFIVEGGSISLEAGSPLFHAGDPGDAAYVVLEGEVEVVIRSEGGRDVRLRTFGAGAVVGEMAALDGGTRSADVVATRRTRLWILPRASLARALEAEPAAAFGLIAELSRRLRVANAALESSRVLDLGGRLAQLILSEMNGQRLVSLTQTEMARRLGVSREKVNRKLHAWADQDWVQLARNGVRVVSPHHLALLPRS